ncbi:MAG: NADH:ubiquinone reductase (Na(+)-transporting) subunit C [Chlamydiales bacterium]
MVEPKKSPGDFRVFLFIISICFICSAILSILTQVLQPKQERSKKLYQSKQMLLSAHILGYDGYFVLSSNEKESVKAIYDKKTKLIIPAKKKSRIKSTSDDILQVYERRIHLRFVDQNGNLLPENEKVDPTNQEIQPIYLISANDNNKDSPPYGFVIPITGQGLWGPITGYLSIAADGNHILGTTWYDQVETPGLGGNISLPEWQKQFYGKEIFPVDDKGNVISGAPLGINVVKTMVQNELSNSPKAINAVDGIPGASVTVTGVIKAYRSSLAFYQPFFTQIRKTYPEDKV